MAAKKQRYFVTWEKVVRNGHVVMGSGDTYRIAVSGQQAKFYAAIALKRKFGDDIFVRGLDATLAE